MAKTTLSLDNVGRPAPRWFRIFKKIWVNTENLIITLLLIQGYTSESKLMLIIKMISSFILTNIETVLANGLVYAPKVDDEKSDSNG